MGLFQVRLWQSQPTAKCGIGAVTGRRNQDGSGLKYIRMIDVYEKQMSVVEQQAFGPPSRTKPKVGTHHPSAERTLQRHSNLLIHKTPRLIVLQCIVRFVSSP
jgi:hypothetical protein